ncbi:phosphatidylinositol 3-kinase [Malassezia cuniculi]|uniref:Phosphatidylinositol 3-kinase VPS34 n=1 Tax=Malassezia cuniculi TaxID=948313 RepID=A0AAF0EW76_9BASI|nr:phosphatidylinositol 3-kinase [Malassezia cuniculi]
MDRDLYTFARSCDTHGDVCFRVVSLEGRVARDKESTLAKEPSRRFLGRNNVSTDGAPPLLVHAQLFASNKPLSPPVTAALRTPADVDNAAWARFPVATSDLPLDAQLALTVLELAGPRGQDPLGACTLPLFDSSAALRRGRQRLAVSPDVWADGRVPSATLGVRHDGELVRLEDVQKRRDRGDLTRVDWLDARVDAAVDALRGEQRRGSELFLYVDLPTYAMPVVFAEEDVPQPHISMPADSVIEAGLFTIFDPESANENVFEAKHRRLVRSQRAGLADRERKPTAAIRDALMEILRYPPTRVLSTAEMDLVWTYRFFLTRESRGLTKFLKSVVWADANEARQATEEMLPLWTAPDVADALELLGPAFRDVRVRAYAVRQLAKADTSELALYLLQLVQALRFDESQEGESAKSGLKELLFERAVSDESVGTSLYWYVRTECNESPAGQVFQRIERALWSHLVDAGSPLAVTLPRQIELVNTLSSHCRALRLSRDSRPHKIERLREMLADQKNGLHAIDPPLALPLDPSAHVTGTIPEASSVFKSNLFPLRIVFSRAEEPYTIIVKNGDDLRQDQLVMQLFALMDRLLRNENLDLRITPYRVLATGAQDGMVQFIPSMPLASIMSEYSGGLLGYMREHYPSSNASTFGVDPVVLDTFVRSCAGYCVITYLLGVGDRHLDNLLLAPDGHFFHVDFSYLFGRDPKPFPPPVKVCSEMVDAMGGTASVHYERFKKLCYISFACLRKNANLILNLISLMVDASIPDIRAEPDKVVLRVQEKFLLDVTEERAVAHFEGLLNETSYISSMFDRLHNMAQYFRQ